jgi:uncharacterized membrane protein (DUF4010 family)
MDSPIAAFERLLVALLIGLLIGLDRERTELRKAHRLFAGVRTFPLIALAGAVPMLLMDAAGPGLLIVSFLAVAAVAVVSYLRGSAAGDIGATTEMAALATFLLGVLAGAGQLLVAGAAGVAVAVLLVAKPRLEGFSKALTTEELSAVLELAVISVIVLPLLPNHGYGPWQVFNPFHIWLVVVLVSALSFSGFIAMRLWGQRQGLIIAGLVGAMISSTAVTMAMATRTRASAKLAGPAASATVLASTVMCLRVAVLTGVVATGILPWLLPVIGTMTVSGLVAAWLLRGGKETEAESEATFTNPFSLTAAVTFAVVYTLLLLGVEAARHYVGARGVYLAAALSALVDVDAISLAIAQMAPSTLGWQVAAAGVAIASVTNTLVKLAIAVVAGAGVFRGRVAAALGVMAAVGALTALVVFVGL